MRRRIEEFLLPESWMVPLVTILEMTISSYLDMPQRQRSRYSGITILGSLLKDIKGILHLSRHQEKPERLYILKYLQEIEPWSSCFGSVGYDLNW